MAESSEAAIKLAKALGVSPGLLDVTPTALFVDYLKECSLAGLEEHESIHNVPMFACEACGSASGVYVKGPRGWEWRRCASCGSTNGPDTRG